MKSTGKVPYLSSRGGVYYFRRGVPKDVRRAFGKREVVVSFDTRDIAVARHMAADELRKFEQTLSEARGVTSPLEQASRSIVTPSIGDIEVAVRSWLLDRENRLHGQLQDELDWDAQHEELTIRVEGAALEHLAKDPTAELDAQWIAEHLLEENGWEVAPSSRLFHRLKQLIVRGKIESNERRRQEAMGEPVRSLDQRFSADSYALDKDRSVKQAYVSLTALLEGSLIDPKVSAKTEKAYRLQFNEFRQFLGHDNASQVTPEVVVNWKEHLQKRRTRKGSTLSAKTINAKYLTVLKRVFKWAKKYHKLPRNPAEGIVMGTAKKQRLRDPSLTDAEALTILRGTMAVHSPQLSVEHRRARRWVPWLCAYTGARVNEITQLRSEDVSMVDGIWAIRITPEAGSVKSNEARIVALHPDLIEQGFVLVAEGNSGPLFYDPERARVGGSANPQSNKVGQRIASWVRSLGVDDPLVQPNHGWRHRFATLSRRHGIPEEYRDQILGHVKIRDGRTYGDTTIDVIAREIAKLPRYVIGKL